MRNLYLFAINVCLVASYVQAENYPVKLVVHVVEETGEVVADADVLVSFNLNNQGGVSTVRKGTTDTNGFYSVVENTSGYIFLRVNKFGYYESVRRLKWHQEQQRDGSFPSSGITNSIKLRRKISPVPMFVKKIYTQIPKPSKEYGYDFEKGDWVVPHGEGQVVDAYFKVEGFWMGHRNNDAVLTIRFPNPKDGLLYFECLSADSSLCSPYTAPQDGYIQEKIWRKSRTPNPNAVGHSDMEVVVNSQDKKANYFFRIRTELNIQGDVQSALYGKIYGDIDFGGAGENGGYLGIRGCYLNPRPNDRNVEFDVEKNLHDSLSSDEHVHVP